MDKEIQAKKKALIEAFGKEKFDRILKEAKDFFTEKEKEARKEGKSIFKRGNEET